MQEADHGAIFRSERVDDHRQTDLPQPYGRFIDKILQVNGLTPSQTRRDTIELRLSRTHVKLWMPAYSDSVILDTPIADLGWDRGVVQLGHHSYTAYKDCGNRPAPCGPGTWHWDNVQIEPATPFTAIAARERYRDEQQPTYTFAQPAPAGAYLRIQALAESLDVSFDGGANWMPQTIADHGGPEADWTLNNGTARTYWTPIPAGATSATLRGYNSWAGSWMSDYAAIWALDDPDSAASEPSSPVEAGV